MSLSTPTDKSFLLSRKSETQGKGNASERVAWEMLGSPTKSSQSCFLLPLPAHRSSPSIADLPRSRQRSLGGEFYSLAGGDGKPRTTELGLSCLYWDTTPKPPMPRQELGTQSLNAASWHQLWLQGPARQLDLCPYWWSLVPGQMLGGSYPARPSSRCVP